MTFSRLKIYTKDETKQILPLLTSHLPKENGLVGKVFVFGKTTLLKIRDIERKLFFVTFTWNLVFQCQECYFEGQGIKYVPI